MAHLQNIKDVGVFVNCMKANTRRLSQSILVYLGLTLSILVYIGLVYLGLSLSVSSIFVYHGQPFHKTEKEATHSINGFSMHQPLIFARQKLMAHLQNIKDVGVFVNCIKANASRLLLCRAMCVLFKLILQYP